MDGTSPVLPFQRTRCSLGPLLCPGFRHLFPSVWTTAADRDGEQNERPSQEQGAEEQAAPRVPLVFAVARDRPSADDPDENGAYAAREDGGSDVDGADSNHRSLFVTRS
jgi:hypothetical protein